MSDQTKTAKVGDNQKLQSRLPPAAAPRVKEQEVTGGKSEDELMVEITTRTDALDREHEAKVRESIADIRRAVPEPAVPPDVEDAGVYSPTAKAEEVVAKGSTIDVGTSEQTYKRGLHAKITGQVVDRVVVGVSSLAALAMWIGRLVKMAHKHAKHAVKIVFRKEAN